MSLNIIFIGGKAEVTHVNVRKQGDDDSRVLALDLKLQGEVQSSALNQLLGAGQGDDFSNMFWGAADTDPESLRTHAIEWIDIDGEWRNRFAYLGKLEVRCHLRKAKVRPRPGHRLDLEASIAIENPSHEVRDYAIESLREYIQCRIDSDPELGFDKGKSKGRAAK